MQAIDTTSTPVGGSRPARAATGHVSPVARELPAELIAWNLPLVSPWPSASPVLDLMIEALPDVEDDLAARLIDRLALTIVDLADELRSVRSVLSASMTRAYEQQLVIDRLHQQIIEMREASRAQRRAAV